MTDRLQELLDHLADDLAGDAPPPLLGAGGAPADARPGRAGRWLAPALAAAAVVAVASVAFVVQQTDGAARTQFAGVGAELGTIDATPLLKRPNVGPFAGRLGDLAGEADLLARLSTRVGDGVLFAQAFETGQVCLSFAYLPPATSLSGGLHCWPGAGVSPFDRDPIVVTGQGPSGSPGGIKTPPVVYGAAPAGTRRIEFSGPDRDSVRVPARDAGVAYNHRAYFAAGWDLITGATLIRALGSNGNELARLERTTPAGASEFFASMCQTNREALRGHFSRAVMVGEKWARTHPQTADVRRLRRPPSGPMEDPAAIERFDYALTQLDKMGPEETYEYRLAANVVLIESECFPASEVQRAAKLFKEKSA